MHRRHQESHRGSHIITERANDGGRFRPGCNTLTSKWDDSHQAADSVWVQIIVVALNSIHPSEAVPRQHPDADYASSPQVGICQVAATPCRGPALVYCRPHFELPALLRRLWSHELGVRRSLQRIAEGKAAVG